jgi:hypothetical protein
MKCFLHPFTSPIRSFLMFLAEKAAFSAENGAEMTRLKDGVSSTVSEFIIVKWFQCQYRTYVHTSA